MMRMHPNAAAGCSLRATRPTPVVRAAPMSSSAPTAAPTAAPAGVVLRTFSRAEDPTAAAAAAHTLALAMSREGHQELFCPDKEAFFQWWLAVANNYQLQAPHVALTHTLNGDACTSYCYWYPDQMPAEDTVERQKEQHEEQAWLHPAAHGVADSVFAFMEEGRDIFLQERGPFLYVAFLGVHQGRGLGSQMLAHFCQQADAAHKWMYLEASNPGNIRLYERFGFIRTGRRKTFARPGLSSPSAALTLTVMARQPGAW